MKLLLIFIALLSGSLAQDYSQTVSWSLPDAVRTRLKTAGIFEKYKLAERVNPFYLRGDFDGDAKADYAVLVVEKASGKTAMVVCLSTVKAVRILGPGGVKIRVGTAKDGYDLPDFDWMDAWQVHSKKRLTASELNDASTVGSMSGEAMMVEKTEAASAYIYWDGSKFRWYQLSD